MGSYELFSKPIKFFEFSDLTKLREVPEGWFLDYKQSGMDIKKIAKHLGAFANTYGGWLFFGVKESNDDRRVAESFPGIKVDKVPSLETQIRNAAIHHLSPTPYFEHFVLEGPSEELGLEDNRAVIIVHIPEGTATPYVHSSGNIYRRTADSSDPIPVTKHSELEHLWERRQGMNTRLERFFNNLPQRLESEKNMTFVHLFFLPDPKGAQTIQSDMKFETFSELMQSSSENGNCLCFDNAFVSSKAAP